MPLNKKPLRFHNLKRPKFRADMRKENLYKLSKGFTQNIRTRTFFQQKWTAKSMTRAYHGEHVREKMWTRMFDRRTNAVVPMNPQYLAQNDGSEQSAGRGSGRQQRPGSKRAPFSDFTPYMQMVYHPFERRLDVAIFRALFATSAKQARQLVLHGAVKVNGKSMIHPSYLLNPGDLFQVNPDRVMYCMGRRRTKGSVIRNKFALAQLGKRRTESTTVEEDNEPVEEDAMSEEEAQAEQEMAAEIEDADPAATAKKTLKSLTSRTKIILEDGKAKKTLSGTQKRQLRGLIKELRGTMVRAASATPSKLDDLEAQFTALASAATASAAKPTSSEEAVEADKSDEDPLKERNSREAEEQSPAMRAAIEAARENPIDPTRPWATPWKPRDWMSAFAFIPRYLEVNQNICAAVYLRHPVCGPGFAEVPTPFAPETGQLAHAWYLRRR